MCSQIVARNFREGVRNCVIVSKQCACFLIPSASVVVREPFISLSQNITCFPNRGCVRIYTLYMYTPSHRIQ